MALSIAAVTLALLASATWGLRQTAMRPDALQQEATDWLTTRRVLQAWAASATAAGYKQSEGRFLGGPARVRLILDDGTTSTARPMMVGLDIVEEAGLYHLSASRVFDVRDIRLAADDPRQSRLIVSDAPLRFRYLVARADDIPGQKWTYEPGPEHGLPYAIAIEQGSDRMIVAQLSATLSALCVSRLGEAGLRDRECTLQ